MQHVGGTEDLSGYVFWPRLPACTAAPRVERGWLSADSVLTLVEILHNHSRNGSFVSHFTLNIWMFFTCWFVFLKLF